MKAWKDRFTKEAFDRFSAMTGWGLIIGFVLIYGATSIRLPVNYADSNDLLLAGKYLGLAHPPGFTWLSLILFPILNWIPSSFQVWGAHLTSSVLSGINVGLMFILGIGLVKVTFRHISNQVIWWGCLLGAILFGLGLRQWGHATMLEVFPMAQLLILVFLLAWVKMFESVRVRRRLWFWSGIAGGVGLMAVSFHPLSGILVGLTGLFGFSCLYNRVSRHNWEGSLKTFLVAGLISSGLFAGSYMLLAWFDSNYSWPIEVSVEGLSDFYFRRVYADGGSAIESLSGELNLTQSVKSVFFHVPIWVRNLSFFGAVLVVVGGVFLAKRKKWLLLSWLLGVIVLSGWAVIGYLKYPNPTTSSDAAYYWGVGLRLRMQFVAAIGYGVAMILGMVGILDWVFVRFSKYFRLTLVISAAILLSILLSGYSKVDASDANLDWVYSRKILETLPNDSILMVDSDYAFQFMAVQQLYTFREDVLIVPVRMPLHTRLVEKFMVEHNLRQIGPVVDYVSSWLLAGLDEQRRVFLYGPETMILDYLGVEGNPFYALPYGYVLEIGRTIPEGPVSYDYGISKQMADYETQPNEWWVKGMKGHMSEMHTLLTYYYARLGYTELAKVHANLARDLTSSSVNLSAIDVAVSVGHERFVNENSYANYELGSWETYLSQGLEALELEDFDEADYLISRAYLMSSGNAETIRALIDYALAIGDVEAGLRWEERLGLLPDN